jgi:thioredoxin 1
MAGNVQELTTDNFSRAVLAASEPVLVDFWAPWCAPCKAIAPHVESIADEMAGQVVVGKLNIDEHQDIAAQYGVRSIPTLLLFKGGKPVDQIVGAGPKQKLLDLVKKHL